MTINLNELLGKVSASPTIEESFLIFFDGLTDELGDIYANIDNHELRILNYELEKYRIPFSKAMAANISQ
jgi:hypothetical protein